MSGNKSDRSGVGGITRRGFIRTSAASSGTLLWLASREAGMAAADETAVVAASTTLPAAAGMPRQLPDLRPARWLWYPSGRCLPNTFVLFRRELELAAKPRRATGWIVADSRYQLRVNGRRIQWGPPPCDPRWAEADPVDLTDTLGAGKNVIGAQVLYYGFGDGTWPIGKPGLLFWLEIEHADGRIEKLVSDAAWRAHLARAWQPGHYKRWYLRSLQEEFDARLFPYGWDTPGFAVNQDWLPAMEINCPPDKPSVCSGYPDYMLEIGGNPAMCGLISRQVPMMRESLVAVAALAESMTLRWKRSPEEYFECLAPDAYETDRKPCAEPAGSGVWKARLDGDPRHGASLVFELAEQVVGWPRFTIEAPAGTAVELLVHEAHQVGGQPLLNSHFHSWTRFICREGVNEFETFDFESLRWMQLHIHGPAAGEVTIRDLGVRRRVFPWPHEAKVTVGEPALQRLMDATVNTLHNCAQENCVDGMARERQQYSGDCGHQLHAIWYAFGETRLPARYLRTFSQGMTVTGYFLDCWPAFDRLNRVMCREVNLAGWGPILDHGVGFNFDCLNYYMYSGDRKGIEEPFPRLVKFAHYLASLMGKDDLLPVENIGVPCVWIDHEGFARPRHKQCAFNLYAAAMFTHALPALCELFGEAKEKVFAETIGRRILDATVKRFWSDEQGVFVDNLPWLGEEKDRRLHDRALATAVLFDQCPGGQTKAAVQALAECPPEMGFSYPANAGWRLWALSKAGRAEVILKDFRDRWAKMDSVRLNNTLAEDWRATPDSGAQWSHCAVVPLYVLYMNIAGIRPLAPGFARCEIRPQLGDLEKLDLVAHTPRGPIRFTASGKLGARELVISMPQGCEGELVVSREEKLDLESLPGQVPAGLVRYRLPAGSEVRLGLKHS